MIWDILNLILGAALGAATNWVFAWRSGKEDKARHHQTLLHNEQLQERIRELDQQLQERIRELERLESESQQRMKEGFASNIHPSETIRRSIPLILDSQALLGELRSRLDVSGQASLSAVRGAFLAQGHSSQAFNRTLDELIHAGTVRLNGKALELV